MKSSYKLLPVTLVGLLCAVFSCRFSLWEPHRLVAEPWFLEEGELPAYVRDFYARSRYVTDIRNYAMHSCALDDYLDAAIGLFLLPKQCESGEFPGEFGGLRMQRVLDAQNRWWRKIEDISLLEIPILLLYSCVWTYVFIGLVGLVLTRRNRTMQQRSR